MEVIGVSCGETREIKLYNNTCANESEVSFNAALPRLAYGITCLAGGTLSRTGTIKHWTPGGPFGFTYTALQTLVYTAPTSLPNCLTTPTDVVRAEARGFTRDLVIKVSCGPPSSPATPTLSPPGGTFIDSGGTSVPVHVNAGTSTAGATIRMSTDGSDPGPGTPARTTVDLPNNLTTSELTIVKARAFKDGASPSGVAQQTYVIKAASPTLSPPGGTYPQAQTVSASTTTPGGKIRYTLDGSAPTPASTQYLGPVSVACGKTLTAAVFKDLEVTSDASSGTYQCAGQNLCNELGGIFFANFTVDSDPGGHAGFINLKSSTLTMVLNTANLSISGSDPSTVTGSGTVDTSTCTGFATGRGTIAGHPNIRCDYAGVRASGSTVSGSYTCGVGGGLPGDQPIRYLFSGTRQ